MANPMLEAAVQSIELEAVDQMLADTVATYDNAYTFARENFKKEEIANATAAGSTTGRPVWRNALIVQGGSAIVAGNGDAQSLYRGTGIQTEAFAQNPAGYWGVTEYSYASEIATRGKDRAITEISTDLVNRAMNSFMTGVSAVLDGPGTASGTISIIPTGATISSSSGSGNLTSYISGLTNAASFTDQMVVQVFSAEGGTNRGTFTVSTVQPETGTIYASTALPSGTASGDYLMINGVSGAQNTGIANFLTWFANSNTGTLAGLSRATYPGRLSTPTADLGGQRITPQDFLRAMVLMGKANGGDSDSMQSLVWWLTPDQLYTLNIQDMERVMQNTLSPESARDVGQKDMSKTFGGRKYHMTYQGDPTKVLGFVTKNWRFGELKEVGLFDFGGGNTIMPVPDIGTSGGSYITDRMFAIDCFFQICNKNPRDGFFFSNCGYVQS